MGAAPAPVMAEEVSRLAQAATSAAQKAPDSSAPSPGSCAETARAVDALKRLGSLGITPAILVQTQVGKPIRKLAKSANATIAAAAKDLVERWKSMVAQQKDSSPRAVRPSAVEDPSANTAAAATATADAATSDNADPAGRNGGAAQMQAKKTEEAKLPNIPLMAGEKTRDKMRMALKMKLALAQGDFLYTPSLAAAHIESELFSMTKNPLAKEYKDTLKTILLNIGDVKNPEFRQRVLSGDICPTSVPHLSPEDMASDERRQENQKIRETAMFHAERGQITATKSGAFKCFKCRSNETSYFQMQTRSADEPMTTFVTCTRCGNKWKC